MRGKIVSFGIRCIEQQLDAIAFEAKQYMEGVAPHPTGRAYGKGSMSTGKLKGTFFVQRTSDKKRFIGTFTSYAKYANKGRGAITTTRKPMKFIGSDGRWHTTYHVESMSGWEFTSKTADYIARKYKGIRR